MSTRIRLDDPVENWSQHERTRYARNTAQISEELRKLFAKLPIGHKLNPDEPVKAEGARYYSDYVQPLILADTFEELDTLVEAFALYLFSGFTEKSLAFNGDQVAFACIDMVIALGHQPTKMFLCLGMLSGHLTKLHRNMISEKQKPENNKDERA